MVGSELRVCPTAVQVETVIWTSLPGRHTEGFYRVACAPSCAQAAPSQCNAAAERLSTALMSGLQDKIED